MALRSRVIGCRSRCHGLAWALFVTTSAVACSDGVIEGRAPVLIDDLEDHDEAILSHAGRQGSWFAFVWSADGNDHVTADLVSAEGRPGSAYAAHFGSAVERYGGLGVSLTETAYDASRYSGVSFWARRSDESVDAFFVAFPNIDTHNEIGNCNTVVPARQCDDHFGCRVRIGTEWQRFVVLFDEIEQARWDGFYHVDTFHASGLKDITVNVRGGVGVRLDFELWLDDLAFVRRGEEDAVDIDDPTTGRCQ